MKYKDYLQTKYWKERRKEFKSKTWQRCFICRNKNCQFDVHHKRYERNGKSILFNEKHTDFRLLCRRCHTAIHVMKLEKQLESNLLKRRHIRDIILGRLAKG